MVRIPRAPLRVAVVHHDLCCPVRGHGGWGTLPVAHLEHRLEHLQVALKGHAPVPAEGAELVEGGGEVQDRVELWLLEPATLPLRHSLEGLEEGVVQLD